MGAGCVAWRKGRSGPGVVCGPPHRGLKQVCLCNRPNSMPAALSVAHGKRKGLPHFGALSLFASRCLVRFNNRFLIATTGSTSSDEYSHRGPDPLVGLFVEHGWPGSEL
jgi:hypothetical protein